MKLQRFYVAEKTLSRMSPGGIFSVADENLANQLKKVFRFHVGDTVVIFDGDGQDHECLVDGFQKDKVSLKFQRSYPSRSVPVRKIWLCAGIVKKDTFEWITEKATELGVTDIVPIMAERSEKKSLNIERLEKIVIEAAEQSGRGDIPTIHPIIELEKSIDYIKSQNPSIQMVAFHTEGNLVRDDISDKSKPAGLFIGPEGGWSEKEVSLFHEENIAVVCLGKQVLRAETAAVAALVKVVF